MYPPIHTLFVQPLDAKMNEKVKSALVKGDFVKSADLLKIQSVINPSLLGGFNSRLLFFLY